MNNVVLSTRNIDDLITDLANEVVKKIELWVVNPQTTTNQQSKKLYSIKELADFLQVSTVTAQKYKNAGLPCIQYGRKVIFDTESVLQWLNNPKKKGL